ncbi:cationic amino acid transporter 4-like [Acanthaster planci]|uniref:Cationic amino acid transporter 4-like n=1 Tax=Acanthaster planci TaxID=133434 RepID=A0A8B7XXK7_ACAPL|nr:cationic amino acid transporter 4-like [Acanthaster planci]
MIGVGSMIGSGVFLLPGQLVGVVAGPISLLAFFISGLIALLAGLCCTECALQIPETGAAYAFAYATLGEMVAFLIGWGGVATRILGVALIAQVWSGYLDEATGGYIQNATVKFVLGGEEWDAPLLSSYPDFVAGLVILASNALVSFGTNVFSKVNNVFVLSTLLTLTFVFIVAMIHANFFYLVEHGFAPRGVGLDEVVASVFTAYLGYAGFETIALCAEEAKDQTKDLLMGLLAAVAISMLVYLAGSLSITVLAEYSNIDLKSPFEAVFDELDGLHWMKYIVAISALCSVTGGALNFAYSSTRFIYPMSRDGLLPAMLSKTSETTKTPLLANFLGACLSLVLGVLIDIKFLIQVPSMLFTLETVGVIFAAVILRYNPTLQSEYMEVESKDESCGTGGSSVPHVNRHHSNLEMKGLLDQMQETFTGDNNAGSDPPSPPSLIKKASTVLFQWIRNHPTRSVILSLCLHITFEFLFVGLLTFTLEDFSQASDSSLVLWIVICGVLCLIACFPLLLLPQYRDELPFKVPLMPFLPLIGLLSTTILLLHFDFLAFIQVLVWTCLGILVYFTYGMKHSVEGARQDGH